MTNETEKNWEDAEEEVPYKVTHKFYIAGVQHHQMYKVLDKLKEGLYLYLSPEPTNKYDPNAIKITFPTVHEYIMLGYIPKRFSSEISAVIEIEKIIDCVIVTFDKNAKPWEQCEVEIREIEEVKQND